MYFRPESMYSLYTWSPKEKLNYWVLGPFGEDFLCRVQSRERYILEANIPGGCRLPTPSNVTPLRAL